jgi:hypothetical protein
LPEPECLIIKREVPAGPALALAACAAVAEAVIGMAAPVTAKQMTMTMHAVTN